MNEDIQIYDDVLDPEMHQQVWNFLIQPGWQFGAVSDASTKDYAFWYKRLAEPPLMVRVDAGRSLAAFSPLLFNAWTTIKEVAQLKDRWLARVYANAYPYGAEGGVHIDSSTGVTLLYYPTPRWEPNYGGENLFFDERAMSSDPAERDKSEMIGAVYPRPNRLVVFPGKIPHVGRGPSRKCPGLRITLMFKAEPN